MTADTASPGPVVIVGAGDTGARAAAALREHGFRGSITLVGDEPHAPYERPPLSKAVLAEPGSEPPAILDRAALAAADIHHLAGVRAVGIDRAARRLLLSHDRTLPYGKLLLATGATPRRLAGSGTGTGTGTGDLLYLRTLADAIRLRETLVPGRRIAIIGGGFIGLEVAAAAADRGCRVTLIEAAPRILMRGVPPAVADRVAARHTAAGVDLRTGIGLHAVERTTDAIALHLADGTVVPADAVVVGIGAMPAVELAEAAGLAIENGIRVDGRLRTVDPDILAAGDCCSFPHPLYGGRRLRLEAWHNAQDQGALAARSILGADEEHVAVPHFWSDQYENTLHVVGLPDAAERTIERDLGCARLFFHLDADDRLVAASGIGPNALLARDVRLAELMIARRSHPDPAALASPSAKLKTLLAA